MRKSILYIGAPEADAAQFAIKVLSDFPSLELVVTNSCDEALHHAASAGAIMGHQFQFNETLLERACALRWIQSLTTGTEAITDLRSLRPEVIVTSTRGMHGPQMSELVFLHMLSLSRDFHRMQRNQQAAHWERWPQRLLLDRVIGIVGVGAIAEALAPRCKAFGMHVIGVSESSRIPIGFDEMAGRTELEKIAARVDFLVLLVPLSASTAGLINGNVLNAMKPTAHVINVARGGVLDEEALLRVVQTGRIAGAALDVFRTTPLPADSPIWSMPNIIVTPMVGGMSDVYLEQAYPIIRENMRCFLADDFGAMRNLVRRHPVM
jgi:D-2-hydroxyacid dehydrogenase (NADP+)